ncbi:HD domain-containing protein, partial [archaeon]|nr:HD domain-containing protein [archaeon]
MALTKKQKQIIKEVHNFVKKECEGFAEDDVFSNHVLGVKNHAVYLAKYYKANEFIAIIAAYLHDIHYIQTENHGIHEIEGGKFAKTYLKKLGLPDKEIGLIAKCILHHRGSRKRRRVSIEEKIIASADAMDHVSRFQHMFYWQSKTMGYHQAMLWM